MVIPRNPGGLTAASRELDWADLHFFLAVSESASLTKAAERLKTTQPTVSKRLDDLERRLGSILVVRTKAGVRLTDSGRFVAGQAAAMARSVEQIAHEVALRDTVPAGEVIIHCPDGLANYFLAPALKQLHHVHPDIQLIVRARLDEATLPDLTVQFHETKKMEDRAISLGWLHYGAFTTQEYLNLYGTPKDVTDALRHRILRHLDYVNQVERWRAKQKPLTELIDYAMRTDCGPFLVNATASGAGISSLPTYVAHVDPRLIMLEHGDLASMRFWLVFNGARGEIPRVRETISWLRGVFDKRDNPWFREEFIHPREFARHHRDNAI
jgi:DNA-binding transcriptional LysR family regulator